MSSTFGDVEDHFVHGISVGIRSPSFTRNCLGWNWCCDKLLMGCFLLAVIYGTHASCATSATFFIGTTPRTRSAITSENLDERSKSRTSCSARETRPTL